MNTLRAGSAWLGMLAVATLSACGGGGGEAPVPSSGLAALRSELVEAAGGGGGGDGHADNHGSEVSELARSQVTHGAGLDAQRHAALVALAKRKAKDREEDGRSATASQVSLNYTSPGAWGRRVHTSSIAQMTPDADGLLRLHDRRQRSVAGTVANWGSGVDPHRQSDYHWTGSAWIQCAVTQEHVFTGWNAGTTSYNFCVNRDYGTTTRTGYDIVGMGMREVYETMLALGTTNVVIAAPETALGSAVYPPGSRLHYYEAGTHTSAVGYYPGIGNVVRNTEANIASGSLSHCLTISSTTPQSSYTTPVATLESMVAGNRGTPCMYPPTQFPTPSGPRNEWWSQSTVGLGILGTVPLSPGGGPTYYTGNKALRVSFGSGNAITYYSCEQRSTDGSVRNCDPIGTGEFSIAPLGDARIMTFSDAPALVGQLPYARVFVERGGKVYHGYINRPPAPTARLNLAALNALATQLGVPTVDPEVPLALTRASYQGDWLFAEAGLLDGTDTLTLRITATGAATCIRNATNAGVACTLTLDPTTGAFGLALPQEALAGTIRFVEGTATATLTPAAGPPVPIEGARR